MVVVVKKLLDTKLSLKSFPSCEFQLEVHHLLYFQTLYYSLSVALQVEIHTSPQSREGLENNNQQNFFYP